MAPLYEEWMNGLNHYTIKNRRMRIGKENGDDKRNLIFKTRLKDLQDCLR